MKLTTDGMELQFAVSVVGTGVGWGSGSISMPDMDVDCVHIGKPPRGKYVCGAERPR